MSELSITWISVIPIIQVIILAGGTLLCYAIAYSRGDVSLYLPFVSETGAYSPEQCIFSLSLILGSFLGCIIMLCRFIVIKQNDLSQGRAFYLLNVCSLFIGVISMLGLAGVAAFPMTTVFWTHLMFAGMYFGGSALYFILVSITTYKIEGKTTIFLLRASLAIAVTIFLFFIVILFPISLVRWHQFNDFLPAHKKPEDKGFTLLLLSSILEWLIVIDIVAFSSTLIKELKAQCFTISVVQDSVKTATSVEGLPVSQN